VTCPQTPQRDSKVGPKTKQRKKKKKGGAHLPTYNISRVGIGGCARVLGWDSNKFTSMSSRWYQFAQPRNE